jgi:hypothetical protein
MRLENIPFQVVDWTLVPATRHPGTAGQATWRTLEQGNVRVRLVEYSPGYLADHWCAKGHVIHVLSGDLITELQDGRTQTTRPGQTYLVADEAAPHRSRSETGVTMFIVD